MGQAEDWLGKTLDGRFRLDAIAGVGGMATVYRAVRLSDAKVVAIKALNPLIVDPTMRRRFEREAQLASTVRHPNVVTVEESGHCSTLDAHFMVMEHVGGVPLSALLDAGLPCGDCCGLIDQILAAVEYVHGREILHRDIKPANVLVVRKANGMLQCKLADFGVALDVGQAETSRLTVAGALVGTASFMAPEQISGTADDGPGLDIYPVGVLLYRLLTGHLPFSGELTTLLAAKASSDPHPPVARTGLSLSPALAAFVSRMLARDPVKRVSTARDARAGLRPFVSTPAIDEQAWDELVARAHD